MGCYRLSAHTTAEEILRINAMGPIYITEHFRPLLAEGGVLMLFSSTAGYMFETNKIGRASCRERVYVLV